MKNKGGKTMSIIGGHNVDGKIHSTTGAYQAPGVDGRMGAQNVRVKEGVQQGQITQEELKQIGQSKVEFNQTKEALTADGELSKEDRLALNQQMNQQSKEIYDLRHNQ